MKQFIVALCLVAVVLANGGKNQKPEKRAPPPEGGSKGPRCNVTRPEGVEKRDCCPGLPKSLSFLTRKTCGGPGGKKNSGDICKYGACIFTNYTTNGEINVDAVANAIAATVQKDSDASVWAEFIKNTVSDCIDSAPVEIQKMEAKVSGAGSFNDTKAIAFIKKFLSCNPKVQTQLAVEFCLKKNLFNNCPTRVTSEKCNALFLWAQSCPYAALHGKGGKGPKNDSSEEEGNQAQKSGNQGKKGEKSEKQSEKKGEKQAEKKGEKKAEKQTEKKGEKQAEKKGDNKNNQGKQQHQQQQQQKKN